MKLLSRDNIEIINEIGKWKAITLQELFKSLGGKKTYSNFCIKVRNLEKANLVVGVFERKQGKYLTLTQEGATCSVYPYADYESSLSITHDLYCTAVIKCLLNCKAFSSGCANNYVEADVEPDGIIHLRQYGADYILAVEVELHQKSKKRVIEKFAKYLDEKLFDNVLYVINKQSVFDAYRKILIGMNDKVVQKIALCFDPSLSTTNYDYFNATYWANGDYKSFQDLFKGGEK